MNYTFYFAWMGGWVLAALLALTVQEIGNSGTRRWNFARPWGPCWIVVLACAAMIFLTTPITVAIS